MLFTFLHHAFHLHALLLLLLLLLLVEEVLKEVGWGSQRHHASVRAPIARPEGPHHGGPAGRHVGRRPLGHVRGHHARGAGEADRGVAGGPLGGGGPGLALRGAGGLTPGGGGGTGVRQDMNTVT